MAAEVLRRGRRIINVGVFLCWLGQYRAELPLPVELRNGHPQNKTISKMGSSYLGMDEFKVKWWREDSGVEEEAWAMRFKPP